MSACSLPFGRLYDELANEYTIIGKQTFIDALDSLQSKGAISRQRHGKYVMFAITATGKALLHQFNERYDAIVKVDILRYGNGLPE